MFGKISHENGRNFEWKVIGNKSAISDRGNKGTIPTRRIYVSAYNAFRPPISIEIRNIFTAFGEIKDIKLRSKFFFVTFFNPVDANNALKASKHLLRNYGYKLKPADQWHQPLELSNGEILWDRQLGMLSKDEWTDGCVTSPIEDPDKPSLLDLNDDCLLHILTFIPARERIRLERVCNRIRNLCFAGWRQVTHLDIKTDFKLNDENKLGLDNMREILLRCGPKLTHLNLTGVSYIAFAKSGSLIEKFCLSLTHLQLDHYTFNDFDFERLRRIAPRLKELKINHSDFSDCGLGRQLLQFCTILESFEALDVYGLRAELYPPSLKRLHHKCCKLEYLGHLKELRELRLEQTSFPLGAVIEILPNLEILELRSTAQPVPYPADVKLKQLKIYPIDCHFEMTQIAAKCPHLEQLTVLSEIEESDFLLLASLSKLKSLWLPHSSITIDGVKEFCRRTKASLESISLDYSSIIGALGFLERFKDLRLLDLTNVMEDDDEDIKVFQDGLFLAVSTRTSQTVLSVLMSGFLYRRYSQFHVEHALLEVKNHSGSNYSDDSFGHNYWDGLSADSYDSIDSFDTDDFDAFYDDEDIDGAFLDNDLNWVFLL